MVAAAIGRGDEKELTEAAEEESVEQEPMLRLDRLPKVDHYIERTFRARHEQSVSDVRCGAGPKKRRSRARGLTRAQSKDAGEDDGRQRRHVVVEVLIDDLGGVEVDGSDDFVEDLGCFGGVGDVGCGGTTRDGVSLLVKGDERVV